MTNIEENQFSEVWKHAMTGRTDLRKSEWDLHLDGYAIKIELIDGNILHSISSGYLEEGYIEAVEKLHREASNFASPPGNIRYYIAGMSDFKGASRKALKRYMEFFAKWHQKNPFHLYVLYGSNHIKPTADDFAEPIEALNVRAVEDLQVALNLIENDKDNGTGIKYYFFDFI